MSTKKAPDQPGLLSFLLLGETSTADDRHGRFKTCSLAATIQVRRAQAIGATNASLASQA
jgi:hypothetical protein